MIPVIGLLGELAILAQGNKGQLVLLLVFLACSCGRSSRGKNYPDAQESFASGIILRKIAGEVSIETKGMANDAQAQEINQDTPFLIASASKTFVAVAILTLVDRQLLSLHDPVKKFFPEAQARWLDEKPGEPTIHQLLNHTSGIPDAYEDPTIDGQLFRNKLSFEQLFSAIADSPLRFAPASKFEYSNTGYIVLGEIIRRTCHSTYQEYLHGTLFTPLAMTHTSVGPHREGFALPYILKGGKRREYVSYFKITEQHTDDTFTDGNIYASARDLLHWEEALFSGRLLSPQTQALMLTDYGSGYGYGINISVDEATGDTIYDHDGEWLGFRAVVRYIPNRQEAFISLENLIP